jgi:very-short-patch-repair endonuclease
LPKRRASTCLKITDKALIIPYDSNNKEAAKKLRRKPAPAERCLWKRLKLKHLGFIFHRQKPVGKYIADFYCPEAKLVVEVDGDYHASTEIAANDIVRDVTMRNIGITVLRFQNAEVLNDTDKVINTIDQVLLGSV